ncbi:MAG: acyl-CoA dehydrogenase family protein [Verrucomicrobia bacterium]|nr:acyl-CoA dehydrogenase family protein [Verrucomicrobiota bacterium]
MDLSLTDAQLALQKKVCAFADEHILPVAAANDAHHHVDEKIIAGMAREGWLGCTIPPTYGGLGLDYVSLAIIAEEIERGDAAFRTLLSVHLGLNSMALLKFGTEAQKQKFLKPQAQGQTLAAFCLTEPDAGSDVAAMTSTAARQPDGSYRLSGHKRWIGYATMAGHLLVFAKTDPRAGHRGISAFVLERGMAGLTTRDIPHKLGLWASSTGEVFMENVPVPAENRIGAEGHGFKIAMHALDNGRFTVAAGALGTIRACLEHSVAYARQRKTFGQEIGRHQFVQDMIAKMVLNLETSRLLVLQAAWLKNQGRRDTREVSLAKWHATESAFSAANDALQIHGNKGFSHDESPIGRYFRNARAPIIYEGTTQIHKMMQAEHALGYRALNGPPEMVS